MSVTGENVLVMAVSPLTGLPISGQSRMTAAAKSPITGGAGDSQCGGFFPAEMKKAGGHPTPEKLAELDLAWLNTSRG